MAAPMHVAWGAVACTGVVFRWRCNSQPERGGFHSSIVVPSGALRCEPWPAAPSLAARPSQDGRLRFGREAVIFPNPGSLADEYDISETLGAGTHGKVFRAKHCRTGALRAIKRAPKVDAAAIGAFVDEVRALIALDHPHIVKVIEYFFEGDNLYLVEEFCTGPDLFDYLQGSPLVRPCGARHLEERAASIILRQCLKAVRCCHQHGFAHRDLKPENFMLTGQAKTIRLIDFGFAEQSAEIFGQVGTYDYMAPELIHTESHYSHSVDVWSLGVLLFVMLTGECLLGGEGEEKLVRLRNADYVQRRLEKGDALAEVNASPEVRDLLRRMLCRDPGKRITAVEALQHPFIERYARQYLGERPEPILDEALVSKLRRFGSFPRLKKIGLFTAAHLASTSVDRGSEELVAAKRLFRTVDLDGRGIITLEELVAALHKKKLTVPGDLDLVLEACDLNGSGTLSYAEFVACILPEDVVSEAICSEAFNLLDRRRNKRIEAKDLQILCEAYGCDEDACSEMIREVCTSGKAWIDFEDFLALMQNGR